MKRADKSGAQFAIIIGDEERDNGEVAVKPLRDNGEQVKVKVEELATFMRERF